MRLVALNIRKEIDVLGKVLVVDPERKRIVLTAKKTLLDSDLPILSKFEDAKVGVVTHAVVFNVSEKHILVEFYNNLKAIVHSQETRYSFFKSFLHLFLKRSLHQ
jgi:rRNA biogenesis protein RRP5